LPNKDLLRDDVYALASISNFQTLKFFK